MPKVKMKRQSTNIDMTAMCDVAFLLLTFFMLATKFKKQDPVMVQTPSSISQISIPDTSIMLITVDNKDRIFFTIDRKNVAANGGNEARKSLINYVSTAQNLNLSEEEKKAFQNGAAIGQPLSKIKEYLAADADHQKQMDESPASGIPVDTSATSPNNELAKWVQGARESNPYLRICIKGDVNTKYPSIDKIISTLGGLKIFRFNLITNLEEVPKNTAAYANAQKKST